MRGRCPLKGAAHQMFKRGYDMTENIIRTKVVNLSGGKDSTCMLFDMLDDGVIPDYVLFCDTGMEFPQMYDHIKLIREKLKTDYNSVCDVTMIHAENSFEYMMFDHIIGSGKRCGQCGYGWATFKIRWCTGYFKRDLSKAFIKTLKQPVEQYTGIAYDEQNRIKNHTYPLIQSKTTEKEALRRCYNRGFYWDGLYEMFDRVSCWCCPLKNQKELRVIRSEFPHLWDKLMEMDEKSFNRFQPRHTVCSLEKKFREEDWKNNGLFDSFQQTIQG